MTLSKTDMNAAEESKALPPYQVSTAAQEWSVLKTETFVGAAWAAYLSRNYYIF